MASFNKKSRNPGYKKGGNWLECQRSGMAIRATDARKEWNGLIVSKDEWEPRHPQDFLKSREDNQAPKGLVNPETADVDVGDVSSAKEAVAGSAVAGLAITGFEFPQDTTIPSGTFNVPTGQVEKA